MNAVYRQYRMRWMAAVLYITPLLVLPATALALFPPVISQPKATITSVPTPPVTIQSVPPTIVGVTGDPGGPIVLTDPPTASNTPEPSTLITCVIGLACAGILMRRKKVPAVTVG